MKITVTILFILLILALGIPGTAAQDDSRSGWHCEFGFEATVHQGPSAGLALLDDLQFDLDASGGLSGWFLLEDGSQVAVAGQVIGRAVNLIFDLGDDSYIYGVGTALRDLRSEDCGGALGGPLVGPQPGDSGGWEKSKGRPGRGVLQASGEEAPEPSGDTSGG